MGEINLQYVHQGISVFNMDESVEWYKNVFDGVVISDYFFEFVNCRIVFIECGGATFELFEYMGEDKKPVPEYRLESRRDLHTGGNKHVCYNLNLPQFYFEKVLPFNVEIDHGPERQGDNWMMFVKDNSGILYELYDIDGAARDPHAFDGIECK